ncbi:hypothetical protein DZC72_06560 [Maribacter algicola]|uniref:Transposase IS200-like domain-containing protein n=1 Tax=Maribacter algicola TaxID=2498892 RepID=A0A3R8R226_9FLAO|nr:transposase [Maribacter algicola]RRQ50221.1 hypothetical protein DZC72_06560 [Maribacter algicola]
MSGNYKFHNHEGLYFVSFAVAKWLDVFSRNEYKDILIESLSNCQNKKGKEIMAWCIMTNHINLVFRCICPERPEQVLGDLKRYTSNQIVKAIKENRRKNRKEFMLGHFKNAAKNSSIVNHHQLWR